MDNATYVLPLRSYEDALALLLGQARPVPRHEHVALADALGRVLAEPVG